VADYLTQAIMVADIGEETLIELTDDESTGSVNTDVLDGCMDDGEADINACLSAFDLPITVLKHGQVAYNTVLRLCKRTCRFHLYDRRPKLMSDRIRESYEDALALADNMAKGRRALGVPPVKRSSPMAPTASHSTVSTKTSRTRPPTRKWTRNSQGNA